MRSKQRSATVALGAGGARGVAHLGAIEELQRGGFTIERYVGVSIGSLAGALAALGKDIEEVQDQAVAYLSSPEFQRHQARFATTSASSEERIEESAFLSWYNRLSDYWNANRLLTRLFRRPGILSGLIMEEVVDQLLPDIDISETATPLSIVAADLRSGRRVVLDRGPLRAAVRGSAAIPGIFPPVEFEGMLLSDIGGLDSLAVSVARTFKPSFIVAVDVGTEMLPVSDMSTSMGVLRRMDQIGEALFREQCDCDADLIVRPKVGHIDWFAFDRAEALIEAGRAATVAALDNRHKRNLWNNLLYSRGPVRDQSRAAVDPAESR
ncbi:patatin-like phospholipase family protein [Stratiformator vulcanicus]|uniref:NTE family protein RssA n=1 Tax=Stratiformator vulcanicus TaxID=2527980 RepID=A0A517QW07_9PLAN|nr:patatin-like phospholipase family protein [Stratiformator vulcanicus]QDT35784.1 NTE family protein RssA [Stratiformator vulcanicus]